MPYLHTPVLIRLPGMVQAQVYCAPEIVSPEFVARVASLVEEIGGLTLSHTIRDVFPTVRKRSIAEEAAAAWAAPKRRLRISNAHTHPEHTQLIAGVMPRRTDSGMAHYGYVTLAMKAGGNAALAVANSLERLVGSCQGVFARADAPLWGEEKSSTAAFRTVRLAIEPVWHIAECLGWVTYFSSHTVSCIGVAPFQSLAALGVLVRGSVAGGVMLQMGAEPLRDSRPDHVNVYQEACEAVSEGSRLCEF